MKKQFFLFFSLLFENFDKFAVARKYWCDYSSQMQPFLKYIGAQSPAMRKFGIIQRISDDFDENETITSGLTGALSLVMSGAGAR